MRIQGEMLAVLGATLGALACDVEGVLVPAEPSLERMLVQPRYNSFQENPFFADGLAMRPPAEGTVAREDPLGPAGYVTGMEGGRFVAALPVPATIELLRRGGNRFAIYCAPCHGVMADGRSVVAENMFLIEPPSLVSERVQGLSLGRVFRVIRQGYGMMPSYAAELPHADAWAVVAYLQVLQRSRAVSLEELPTPYRNRALQALGEQQEGTAP